MNTKQSELEFNFGLYQSEFSWRYSSVYMRQLWSEETRKLIWRRVWYALANAQNKVGLLSEEELQDIKLHIEQLDLFKSHKLRKMLRHEIVAELTTFSDQCSVGGEKIHLGATSSDIEDNADVLRIFYACNMIKNELVAILHMFVRLINKYAELVVPGRTHLRVAVPTTLGYRFCVWAQDFWQDLVDIERLQTSLRAKGFKGAVGTSASFTELLAKSSFTTAEMEGFALEILGLKAYEVTGQTYPRKQDLAILSVLSSTAQSAHKFALDIRILQSDGIQELSESFSSEQVGSSAMPHKRNPVMCEKICSLARFVSGLTSVAWQNAANTMLERTLDDSANRRTTIAEAFLALDEILLTTFDILSSITVFNDRIHENTEHVICFMLSENLLSALIQAGIPRQDAYRTIQTLAHENMNRDDWIKRVYEDKLVSEKFTKQQLASMMQNMFISTKWATQRSKHFAKQLTRQLNNYPDSCPPNSQDLREQAFNLEQLGD